LISLQASAEQALEAEAIEWLVSSNCEIKDIELALAGFFVCVGHVEARSAFSSVSFYFSPRGQGVFEMSSNADLDNRDMSLSEALLETVGMDAGTMISCNPGKLAYVKLEGCDGRYILER
jgi:hypothetical protein